MAPSRLAFDKAVATNQTLGHESLGPLSTESGFLPSTPPLLNLPAPFQPWDEVAGRLPTLFSNLTVRQELDRLPVLPADQVNLPDKYLLRASSLMSILAHSYYRVEPDPPAKMPDCIMQPWTEISNRLGKPHPFLSYLDLIMYNWRLRDPNLPPLVENLDLLFPTVGTEEERVFYLTQIEIAYKFAPLLTSAIRAQEAALQDDPAALERELLLMLEGLQHIAHVSFQKIDPNPYSPTAVDQVVWAKTVAPFAVPITPETPGPSGTAAPIFHFLDAFLGRKEFKTLLGHEAQKLGKFSPPHWQDLILATGEVSVLDYIYRNDYRTLRGLFFQVMEAYAGEKGYLGVHRLKVYGFLENAFKAGRSVTIGGFKGLFRNKTWDQIDYELKLTSDERYIVLARHRYTSRIVQGRTSQDAQDGSKLNFIELDISNTGLRYRPGDRAGIFPENNEELIEKTLQALRASGDETVELSQLWRETFQRFDFGYGPRQPLRALLKYGRIRPVTRPVAKHLAKLTASPFMEQVLNSRMEDQWELWDLLGRIKQEGYDVRRFWRASAGEAESICRIVLPEAYRLYSIASSNNLNTREANTGKDRLQLIVGGLKYKTSESELSREQERFGTASSYIERVIKAGPGSNMAVTLKVVPAARFSLPDDPARPVVMFAAGSGIAPFSGFLQARLNQEGGGENWLFFATRNPEQLFYHREFEPMVRAGRLNLQVAFSASDTQLRFDGQNLVLEPAPRARIDKVMLKDENVKALWDLLRPQSEGGKEAYFYVCGRTDFARKVMDTLQEIIQEFTPGEDAVREEATRQRFYRVFANRRYMQDVYTTYSPAYQNQPLLNASEVVEHNNAEKGYWLVINGKVYDLTQFIHLHPGGMKILINNVGTDGTAAYQTVLHHVNSEVDAMLGMYEIGAIRRLDFGQEWGIGLKPEGLFYFSLQEAFETWVRLLYLVTAMQNAIENDFSYMDKIMARGDRPETITPYKLQFLIEAHHRIFTNYLDGLLNEEFVELWQMALGLTDRAWRANFLETSFNKIRQSPGYLRASQLRQTMLQMLKEGQLDKLTELGWRCVAEDKRLFAEIKTALRLGLQEFENWEKQTKDKGIPVIRENFMKLPRLVQTYYNNLAIALDEIMGTSIQPVTTSTGFAPTSIGYPGHGSALQYSSEPVKVED
ncbi:MAG TPA: cytochrome b5 domain-containing protein [Chloroflexia bacterium]|nr:cytochrome b5 domain-containing protein [Chloroflexia bacterium]